jgi:hypothetical protein
MKIEREREKNGEYQRWLVELHPWVEKSAAITAAFLLTGGAAFLTSINF